MSALGTMGRFDPVMVGWQTCLVNNELDINNFDFNMWAWWMNLLSASGLTEALARFVSEKGRLLEAFGCFREIADKIGDLKMKLCETASTHTNSRSRLGGDKPRPYVGEGFMPSRHIHLERELL